MRFSKEDVFWTKKDGGQGRFWREIQILSVATDVNMRKTMEPWTKNDGAGALLAGNSNSVKIANQDCGPVANVEYEEDDGEDHFAH